MESLCSVYCILPSEVGFCVFDDVEPDNIKFDDLLLLKFIFQQVRSQIYIKRINDKIYKYIVTACSIITSPI